MSRAFVKETDDAGEPLPELSVSPHPNFVTPTGLNQIEARVARLVPALDEPPEVVRFGVTVAVRFDDDSERAFKIVGEDEADPARGLVSFVSPLAKELLGKGVGDAVQALGRVAEIAALSDDQEKGR